MTEFRHYWKRPLITLLSGSALANALIVLSSPLLTRLYSPDELGQYGVFLSVLLTCLMIGSFRYDTYIPLEADRERAKTFVALSGISAVLTTILLFTVLQFTTLQQQSVFMGASFFFLMVYQIVNQWQLHEKQYHNISKMKWHLNGSQAALQITGGIFHGGIFSLLVGDVAGRVVSIVQPLWMKQSILFQLKWLHVKQIHMLIREKRWAPIMSSLSMLLSTACQYIPTIMIASTYGTKEAGYFFLAQKIVLVPDSLYGYPVAQLYISKITDQLFSSKEQAHLLYKNYRNKLSVSTGVLYLVICLIIPLLIPIVFGAEWGNTSTFVQLLSIFTAVKIMNHPFMCHYYLCQKVHIEMLIENIRFFFVMLSLYFVHRFQLSSEQFCLIYVCVMTLPTFIHFFVTRNVLYNYEVFDSTTTPSRVALSSDLSESDRSD